MTKWLLFSGVVAIAILAALVTAFSFAPAGDGLRKEAMANARNVDSSSLDAQLQRDTGYQDVRADLAAKWNDVYEFALTSMSGGGVTLIARLGSDGHFSVLWQGQDIPPCAQLSVSDIPPQIEPYCLKSEVIDRSNVLRSIYTALFNPYVNSDGLITL